MSQQNNDALILDVENALSEYKTAATKRWIRQSEASRKLSLALARLLGAHIGPDLEARVTLYPVTAKDRDDEMKAVRQDALGADEA